MTNGIHGFCIEFTAMRTVEYITTDSHQNQAATTLKEEKSKVEQTTGECVQGESEFSEEKKTLIIPDVEIELCDAIKRERKKATSSCWHINHCRYWDYSKQKERNSMDFICWLYFIVVDSAGISDMQANPSRRDMRIVFDFFLFVRSFFSFFFFCLKEIKIKTALSFEAFFPLCFRFLSFFVHRRE